jgi:CheY-like chemotaxis protein
VNDDVAALDQLRARMIAMTANAMVGDRDKALAAGMNDHVAKQIKPAQLFGTLSLG